MIKLSKILEIKKSNIYIILFLILLLISGCSSKNGKATSERDLKNKFKQNNYSYKNHLVCDAFEKNIAEFNDNLLSTGDKVYEFNYMKLYSNNQNCKELELSNLDSKIASIGYNEIETETCTYFKRGKKFSIYDRFRDVENCINERYKQLHSLGENVFYTSNVQISGIDGIVVIDNIIKGFKEKINHLELMRSDNYLYFKYYEIENPFEKNEKILSVSGSSIKTNKAYYNIKRYKTNKEECDKYVDVKCTYGYKIVKNSFFTNNYDNIIATNGNVVIDKYHNLYFKY